MSPTLGGGGGGIQFYPCPLSIRTFFILFLLNNLSLISDLTTFSVFGVMLLHLQKSQFLRFRSNVGSPSAYMFTPAEAGEHYSIFHCKKICFPFCYQSVTILLHSWKLNFKAQENLTIDNGEL